MPSGIDFLMIQITEFGSSSIDEFINECISAGKIGTGLKKLFENTQKALDSGSPSEARMIINEHAPLLERLREMSNQAWMEFLTLQRKIEEQSIESTKKFENEFVRIAEEAGLTFCEGTLHPRYLIDRSFLELQVSMRNQNCILKTRGGREVCIGIEPQIIVKNVKANLERLHNRNLSVEELHVRIRKTYSELISGSTTVASEGVRLKDFVKAYQKNHQTAVDETLIDISKAKKNSTEITLDFIRDHEDGYQLYGFEEHGYYGFLRLEGQ
jgi:hypothetical protein